MYAVTDVETDAEVWNSERDKPLDLSGEEP